jgi:acyl-CoA thioester hydrolase
MENFSDNSCGDVGKNRPPFALCTFRAQPYAAAMAAATFRYSHRVTYAECTVGNHIYYARYLDLLEAARGAFFRELGASFLQWQERDMIFPVIECRLRYKAPARYDDVLTVEMWLTAVERVRLNFFYRITNQANALILEAETFHVSAGLNEKPKRLPEELADRLRPYLPAAEGNT